GRPEIIFRASSLCRGPAFIELAILIGESRCPFDRVTLLQVYETIAHGTETLELATIGDIPRCLAAAAESTEEQTTSLTSALDFLELLICETVTASAPRLIDNQTVKALLDRLGQIHPERVIQLRALDPAFVRDVLRRLVGFHIALNDSETIGDWLVHGQQSGR